MIPNIGYLLSDNSRLLRRLFDQRVSDLGLTAVQARLLLALEKFPEQNQAFYADRIEVEPITLTRLADRMEEAGWIERRPAPQDRRARILALTEKAQDIVKPLRAIVDRLVEDILEGIDAEEREQLARLLAVVGNNMTAQRETLEITHG
ncbi:MarR family transcriptional regulator [Qipengyuania sp. GH1]|uniref:MarR family winged helix-turn-helix transcriptional regulator n=1 Tax=Qipengyuania aestuarii TaxID=2867241 RepID=UPI001C86714E|nr:MarR family transcriptional regulator [Qipengyuania aestuarii]MBX7534097.1 MarR family transcriptional regulator [Qipengyuania aestuarii]